jgi:energy-coupling factor transporter ATP-binding protein EcfA2
LAKSRAEPGDRFTYDFEEHVAYLAQRADQTTVARTMREELALAKGNVRAARMAANRAVSCERCLG